MREKTEKKKKKQKLRTPSGRLGQKKRIAEEENCRENICV